MKKILIFLIFLINFAFADFLVTYSGSSYCATGFTQHSSDTRNYVLMQYYNATGVLTTLTMNRPLITSTKTGYTYNATTKTCDPTPGKENHNIVDYMKLIFYYPNLPSLSAYISALDQGNANNLFNIKPVYKYTFASGKVFCSSGFGHSYSSSLYMYTPEYPNPTYTQWVFSSTTEQISKIQFNYTYNYLTKECFLSEGDTPYDLPKELGTPTDSVSKNTPTQPDKFKSYYSLFESANNLPNPNPEINDITIDTTKASTNCDNPFMTLNDKLLCEINNHLRKINQESNPEYSINNLIGILNTSHNNNTESINKEIKALSGYESVRTSEQKNTNSILDNMKNNQESTNQSLSSLNTSMQTLNTTLGNSESITPPITEEPSNPDLELQPEVNLNLDDYFKKDEETNTNELDSNIENTDSIIDSFFGIFNTFSSNITNSFTTIKTQIEDTRDLIVEPSNIFNSIKIVNCPTSYEADFSTFGLGTKFVVVDYCHYMSYLQPIIYFFTYVSLMIALIIFTFRLLGVLL